MGTTDQLFELYKMSSVPSVVVSFVTVYLSCLEEKEGEGGRKILESQRAGMYTEREELGDGFLCQTSPVEKVPSRD